MARKQMSRKLPSLKALRTFEAAARLLSFTKAADELFVTHGAVSQQIKVLEQHFGQPLFVRSHGGVRLSAAGEELLPVIGECLDRLERVSSRLTLNRDAEILTVNLTATFASQWLIPRLADFQERHPEIAIRLSPTPSLPSRLGKEADVSIRWGGITVADVVTEKLISVDSFVACAPALLSGDNPLREPADLAQHSLIHDDNGQAWRALLEQLKVDAPMAGRGVFYADPGLALQVAVEGRGVIVAGSILAAKDLAAGRLVIPFNCIIPHRKSYHFYYPQQALAQRKVKLFRDWIQDQAASYQDNSADYSDYFA